MSYQSGVVPDWLERREGTNPLLADFPTFDGANDDDGGVLGPDGDGVADGLEGWLVDNGAFAPVNTLTDSDADGLPDVAEVRGGFDPFDGERPLIEGDEDTDGDGIPDFRDVDSDGDGITDMIETEIGHLDADGGGVGVIHRHGMIG